MRRRRASSAESSPGRAAVPAVGEHDDRRAAPDPAAVHRVERVQRLADAGAARPVLDDRAEPRERALGVARAQLGRHARQAGSEDEGLDAAAGGDERVHVAQQALRVRAHRARHVADDDESARALARRRASAGAAARPRSASSRGSCGARRRWRAAGDAGAAAGSGAAGRVGRAPRRAPTRARDPRRPARRSRRGAAARVAPAGGRGRRRAPPPRRRTGRSTSPGAAESVCALAGRSRAQRAEHLLEGGVEDRAVLAAEHSAARSAWCACSRSAASTAASARCAVSSSPRPTREPSRRIAAARREQLAPASLRCHRARPAARRARRPRAP